MGFKNPVFPFIRLGGSCCYNELSLHLCESALKGSRCFRVWVQRCKTCNSFTHTSKDPVKAAVCSTHRFLFPRAATNSPPTVDAWLIIEWLSESDFTSHPRDFCSSSSLWNTGLHLFLKCFLWIIHHSPFIWHYNNTNCFLYVAKAPICSNNYQSPSVDWKINNQKML